jgi:uncharacterized protein (TIGR02452 family)
MATTSAATSIISSERITADLFSISQQLDRTSWQVEDKPSDGHGLLQARTALQTLSEQVAVIAQYAFQNYGSGYEYFRPSVDHLNTKISRLQSRIEVGIGACSLPSNITPHAMPTVAPVGSITDPMPTAPANVEERTIEDAKPSAPSSVEVQLATISFLLRTGDEKGALALFQTLDPTFQGKIFGKLWEIAGRPTYDSADARLRAMAHHDFGKVSFLGTEKRCETSQHMRALAVELCLTPSLVIKEIQDASSRGDLAEVTRLFKLLPPKLQGTLCGKMWEVMGKPMGIHHDYGRVAFLGLEGISAPNAKRAEAAALLVAESETLEAALATEIEKVRSAFTQIDAGSYNGKSYSRGQEKYDGKKEVVHGFAETLVGLLVGGAFSRVPEPADKLTSTVVSQYCERYPAITPYLLLFSPKANETLSAHLIESSARKDESSGSASAPLVHIPDRKYLEGKAPGLAVHDVGAQKTYRAEVMQDTLSTLRKGGYQSPSGKEIRMDVAGPASTAALWRSAGTQGVRPGSYRTQITVIERDCLEIAQILATRGNPIVLNMAADGHFGGGFLDGARAQEEDLCRRSGLSFAMDTQFGVQKTNFYPLRNNGDAAGVYVANVPVFRGGYESGYQYLEQPFAVAFASVAAFRKPALETAESGELRLSKHHADVTREKIRTVLEMAYRNGHKSIVLSALGAGAFANPPKHIAELFREVIEREYPNCFEEIVFAIIDYHNTRQPHNPEGNFKPFAVEFSKLGAQVIAQSGTVV